MNTSDEPVQLPEVHMPPPGRDPAVQDLLRLLARLARRVALRQRPSSQDDMHKT
jgi:hypothetical protein